MIRKPPASWQQPNDDATIRTVRTAAAIAKGGVSGARRGGHAMRGALCYLFAAIWGFAAIASGLAMGSLPSFIGIGAMAAFMVWAGSRAFAKARETSG
jgi:hypothetical protein